MKMRKAISAHSVLMFILLLGLSPAPTFAAENAKAYKKSVLTFTVNTFTDKISRLDQAS